MKPRQKSYGSSVSACSFAGAVKRSATDQQISVLPIFPSAPKPPRRNKRQTVSNKMLNNSEDILLHPCNTIILQTTIDGKVQVSRTQKERERNPDRLSLDRRGLTVFPILVGEAKLRLLSLQHNLLTKLEKMALLCLPHLVFLDIYNNQLEQMAAFECLHHLRVLLLGKNKIKFIDGLSNMTRLEVLDLHGNQIKEIRNLKNQKELKVLNLAGNEIKTIGPSDLEGLVTLQEMNLRRNQIKSISGFAETPQLLKLFLSNNDIASIEDMSVVIKLQHLKELSLDGNPVLTAEDCILFIVTHIPSVQIFGQTKITDDIKKIAKVWQLRKEFNDRSSASFDADRLRAPADEDCTRARSASENRIAYLRKRSANLKLKEENTNAQTKHPVRYNSCSSAKPNKVFEKNAKIRRADYSKRKNVSFESYNGSETSIEYFRLPPILTSSLNSADDCNVVIRHDPNTSMESNKSFCSARCESMFSADKIEDSSTESESESKSDHESDGQNVCSNFVPAIQNGEPVVTAVKENKEMSAEIRTSLVNDTKICKAGKITPRVEKIKEQGRDYLVQISGRYLTVTGKNSARYIDKAWNTEKANDVTTIKFSCVLFNSLASVFNRIKIRFQNAEHLVFSECEFNYVGQLNALADVQGLTSLEILPERNDIVSKNWRIYAIFRLHHWGLKTINHSPVTEDEIRIAKEEFKGLSEMVLWSLPESLLTPLLNKLRLEVNSNVSAKQWLYKADPALRSVICKEALQWRPSSALSQTETESREKGKEALFSAVETGCNMILKLRKLNRERQSIMQRLVREALKEYSNMEEYVKQQMRDLEPP